MKTFRDFIVLVISFCVLILVAGAALLMTLPNVTILEKCFTTTMFQVHLCPGSPNYVRLSAISPYAIHAVIAAEAGSFYSHKGFDWNELQASFTTNLMSGKFRRGGSTLTQQLAKNAFLNQDKTPLRKIKEAYLAHAIEGHYKKDLILEKYLNVVEFGPKIYGIKAAAQHYFHKSPSQLHPLEGAYLAHLLPNPKSYSKGARNGQLTAFNKKMIRIILKRMASFGKISSEAYQTAIANIDGFPWGELAMDSFQGTPSYSLEAPMPRASDFDELDEESLEEIIEENEPIRMESEPPADLEQ